MIKFCTNQQVFIETRFLKFSTFPFHTFQIVFLREVTQKCIKRYRMLVRRRKFLSELRLIRVNRFLFKKKQMTLQYNINCPEILSLKFLTLSSISLEENSFRIDFSKDNSVSKSIAPIFILIVVKPCCNLSFICCCIKALSPIHINPLIPIGSLPNEKSEGYKVNKSSLFNDKNACSRPN